MFYTGFIVSCQQTKLQQTCCEGFLNRQYVQKEWRSIFISIKFCSCLDFRYGLLCPGFASGFSPKTALHPPDTRYGCILTKYLYYHSNLKRVSDFYFSFPNFKIFLLFSWLSVQDSGFYIWVSHPSSVFLIHKVGLIMGSCHKIVED